ncbi:P-loop containing nucleoside triphosphate hydrolase protein [Kalaharituber pfeilii]|nr:P-loop containing nucleoside triphosphate hydrolase protein [Kalaharituber pfeilii]
MADDLVQVLDDFVIVDDGNSYNRPPPPGPAPPHHGHSYGPSADHPLSPCHRGHGPHRKRGFENPSLAFMNHSSAPFANTSLYIYQAVVAHHPKAACIATDAWNIDFLAFASAPENGAKYTPNDSELPGFPATLYQYIPPIRRPVDEENYGFLVGSVIWGRYDYAFANKQFILYVAEWDSGFSTKHLQVVVHEPKGEETILSSRQLIQTLLLRVGYWNQELHKEVWVFDEGFWQKDQSLWNGMEKANWDDVILPPELKNEVRSDVTSFFNNKSTYDDLGIAWKRGVIFYGPPGNGKTISLKAVMKELFHTLKISPIPTLYVALRMIFEKARSDAPCMLVFEDLDSLINPGNRSYFLNQMDGLDDNNGILVVGTTNHLDELDPGIVARPSRFDRKYEFGLPGTGEGGRPAYVQYWRKKLEKRPGIDFPESLVDKIVEATEGFSFAYMKEAFVSTLLLIAAGEGDDDDKDGKGVFERVIMQQLKNLKKQLGGN